HTVALRAQAPTAENSALLAAVTQRLATQGTAYLKQASPLTGSKKTDSLRGHCKALQVAAQAFVSASDSRRAAFFTYGNNFDQVDALRKGTLDHTWTIFGRVIARQSLISMSRDLDDIRRKSAQLTAAGGYEQAVLEDLAASESKFAATLERNEIGLAKAQGA